MANPTGICEVISTILPPDMMVSAHFSVQELSCRHCGRLYISPVLLEMLETLRRRMDMPLTPNSGYRCPQHNKNIGGSKRSQHCLGLAVDINVPDRRGLDSFVTAAEEVAQEVRGGFHYYPRGQFVHIDCWPWPRDRRW